MASADKCSSAAGRKRRIAFAIVIAVALLGASLGSRVIDLVAYRQCISREGCLERLSREVDVIRVDAPPSGSTLSLGFAAIPFQPDELKELQLEKTAIHFVVDECSVWMLMPRSAPPSLGKQLDGAECAGGEYGLAHRWSSLDECTYDAFCEAKVSSRGGRALAREEVASTFEFESLTARTRAASAWDVVRLPAKWRDLYLLLVRMKLSNVHFESGIAVYETPFVQAITGWREAKGQATAMVWKQGGGVRQLISVEGASSAEARACLARLLTGLRYSHEEVNDDVPFSKRVSAALDRQGHAGIISTMEE